MKATEKFFPVVLLIMLHKLVLTFESVDQILMKTPEHLIFVCTDYNAPYLHLPLQWNISVIIKKTQIRKAENHGFL